MRTPIRAAVVGYGGTFNMGKYHGDQMLAAGFELVAACDRDPARLELARQQYPGIRTYLSLPELLQEREVDLITLITPPDTHCDLGLQILQAGKHLVCEKPFTLTVAEATRLMAAARSCGVLLTVYHNRRWDGRFRSLQDAVLSGRIGELFHLEFFRGSAQHAGRVWRSDKAVSGGLFYDWGAHHVDWVLQLKEQPVRSVRTYTQKRRWHDITNEDHVDVVLTWADSSVAFFQQSNLAHAAKPWVRVLGTEGALVDRGTHWDWHTEKGGVAVQGQIPIPPEAHGQFYVELAAHFQSGAPLPVTPESARRNVAVLEAAELSARTGREVPVWGEEQQ